MKMLLRLTPMVLIAFGLFFIVGCEESDDEVNPLVGSWDFSNMEQASTYMATANTGLGATAGDTLAEGGLVWAEFQALGVSGNVTLLEDGTFTLSGNFPIANDTLGVAPTIVPLTDGGSWTEGETAGYPTLSIAGAFYQLGGVMTLSDDENMITLVYNATTIDTVTLPVYMGPTVGTMYFAGTELSNSTTTTLGFTRQ